MICDVVNSFLSIALTSPRYSDFLNELPDQECTRIPLLDCCASFGSSRYDVNTSLTATGMLWSIADQDSSPASVDVSQNLTSNYFLTCTEL